MPPPCSQIDKKYTRRLINALKRDIDSHNHSSDCNNGVLARAINLLKNPAQSELTQEQIIRGAINLALSFEVEKYRIYLGDEIDDCYLEDCDRWYKNNPSFEEKLRAASEGPLYVMSACVPETLALYFEYAQQLNDRIAFPQPPLGETHFRLGTDETAGKEFEVKMIEERETIVSRHPDADELFLLKAQVRRATKSYIEYSDKTWFSLFHRHGKTGRVRAEQFAELIEGIDNYDEAKRTLAEFLGDSKNGNTHPHSYRTMLLNQLSDAYAPYDHTSKKYEQYRLAFTKQNSASPIILDRMEFY